MCFSEQSYKILGNDILVYTKLRKRSQMAAFSISIARFFNCFASSITNSTSCIKAAPIILLHSFGTLS